MKHFLSIPCLFLSLVLVCCTGKTPPNPAVKDTIKNTIVGGGCDGCELMFQGIPQDIAAIDTCTGWKEPGQKLILEGTVFARDGKTPAPGVIVYYWQTDHTGEYSKTAKEQTIHGHLRGWMKSGANGNFRLYTVRPASYPKSDMPAHIHFSVKEPAINEYYIDDLLFDDDPFLTEAKRKKLPQRGGNGIGKPWKENGIEYIRRDIVLGFNIPGYPG